MGQDEGARPVHEIREQLVVHPRGDRPAGRSPDDHDTAFTVIERANVMSRDSEM